MATNFQRFFLTMSEFSDRPLIWKSEIHNLRKLHLVMFEYLTWQVCPHWRRYDRPGVQYGGTSRSFVIQLFFCQSSVKPYLIYRLDGFFWCSRLGWKYNLVDNGSLDISSLFLTRARLPFIVTVLFYANRSLSPMSPLPSPSASVWWARGILEHARFITSTALNRLPPSLFFGCL